MFAQEDNVCCYIFESGSLCSLIPLIDKQVGLNKTGDYLFLHSSYFPISTKLPALQRRRLVGELIWFISELNIHLNKLRDNWTLLYLQAFEFPYAYIVIIWKSTFLSL